MQSDGAMLVQVTGEVDVASVDVFDRALAQTAGKAVPIIVDLTKTEFIDSTGLMALLRALEQAQRRRVLIAVIANRADGLLFAALTLDRLIRVFPDAMSAREYLKPQMTA